MTLEKLRVLILENIIAMISKYKQTDNYWLMHNHMTHSFYNSEREQQVTAYFQNHGMHLSSLPPQRCCPAVQFAMQVLLSCGERINWFGQAHTYFTGPSPSLYPAGTGLSPDLLCGLIRQRCEQPPLLFPHGFGYGSCRSGWYTCMSYGRCVVLRITSKSLPVDIWQKH